MTMGKQKIRRVVVVDDSRTAQAILDAAFSGRPDFELVEVAQNAVEGENMIRRLAPDLVTIDLSMPYIDGAGLLERIGHYDLLCKVIVSDQAVANIGLAAKLEALGADLCISKRLITDNPVLFFGKLLKACKRVEEAAIGRLDQPLVLSSDVTRTSGVRLRGLPVNYGWPVPADENMRLAMLQAKQLANAVKENHFDRITQLTAEATDFPVCLLTFIDRDTQWIKSAYGFQGSTTSRAEAVCNHVIATGALFTVSNMATDTRFAALPSVAGSPGFRTYAGCPVVSNVGVRLGSLCILDTKVRPLTVPVTRKLTAFADIISGIVEARPTMAA